MSWEVFGKRSCPEDGSRAPPGWSTPGVKQGSSNNDTRRPSVAPPECHKPAAMAEPHAMEYVCSVVGLDRTQEVGGSSPPSSISRIPVTGSVRLRRRAWSLARSLARSPRSPAPPLYEKPHHQAVSAGTSGSVQGTKMNSSRSALVRVRECLGCRGVRLHSAEETHARGCGAPARRPERERAKLRGAAAPAARAGAAGVPVDAPWVLAVIATRA
jgi:hypothetical protein